eukprot:s105_g12.t1
MCPLQSCHCADTSQAQELVVLVFLGRWLQGQNGRRSAIEVVLGLRTVMIRSEPPARVHVHGSHPTLFKRTQFKQRARPIGNNDVYCGRAFSLSPRQKVSLSLTFVLFRVQVFDFQELVQITPYYPRFLEFCFGFENSQSVGFSEEAEEARISA